MPIQMAIQLTAHRLIFPIKIKSGWNLKMRLIFDFIEVKYNAYTKRNTVI